MQKMTSIAFGYWCAEQPCSFASIVRNGAYPHTCTPPWLPVHRTQEGLWLRLHIFCALNLSFCVSNKSLCFWLIGCFIDCHQYLSVSDLPLGSCRPSIYTCRACKVGHTTVPSPNMHELSEACCVYMCNGDAHQSLIQRHGSKPAWSEWDQPRRRAHLSNSLLWHHSGEATPEMCPPPRLVP